MNRDNILEVKSYAFALRIVKLSRYLQEEQKEHILSKQILRSGTAIGALISESVYAQSKSDFISKLHIAIKEANETQYWLNLLKNSDYITVKMFDSIEPDIIELLKLLTTSLKTAKDNNA